MRTRHWVIGLGLWGSTTLGACGGETAKPPERAPDWSHTFPALTITAREELPNQCMSWTIGNDEPLWVNTVRATNEGGFHHSNWVYVPDTAYDGPDGNWPCDERGFEQVTAANMGGVFFAQSTQARADEQRFPEGVAFEIPPHSRIIGQVHALNLQHEDVTTQLSFEVFTLPADDVSVQLRSMAFTNLGLDIAPQSETHARMDCNVPDPDFDVYYVLPHYHELGTTMHVSVVGGPNDGQEIFTSTASYGDALGGTLDPPITVGGATHLRIECDYDNPRDTAVGYGIGDQEMCVVLIYSDTERQAGGLATSNSSNQLIDGVHVTDAACLGIAL